MHGVCVCVCVCDDEVLPNTMSILFIGISDYITGKLEFLCIEPVSMELD